MQQRCSYYQPYQTYLPQTSTLQKSFFPPFPSFQQQQQQQYYDPYLRPLKAVKATYKELYYGHKPQTCYQLCHPVYSISQKPWAGYNDKNKNCKHKKQVESLDRKVQGMNGKKNRTLDYFSDGETQIADQYLYGAELDEYQNQYHFEMKKGEVNGRQDDFAGIKELSRSLSRRKKVSKLRLDQLNYQQKQLRLEKQIERQEQRLYFLQQQLKLELQQKKQHFQQEQQFPLPTYFKPTLRYKPSYPNYFDQFERDQITFPHYPQNTYQPYYPPLQFELDAHFPYDVYGSKSRRKQKHKNGEKQKFDHTIDSQDDLSFNTHTPPHRKRCSSDSDIQNGNGNYGAMTSSPSTSALQIAPGLLSNAEKSNSLPAEIENGASSSNGDDPSQLKHWLRKLDRLSYDLKEFNGRLKNGNNLKGWQCMCFRLF